MTKHSLISKNLMIGYVVTGKMYDNIKNYIEKILPSEYKKFNGNGICNYLELGNKLKSWIKFRRAIFTTLDTDEKKNNLLQRKSVAGMTISKNDILCRKVLSVKYF